MKPGIVPLRPLGVGEILDGAITAVRRAPSLLLVSGVVAVITVLTHFLLSVGLRTDADGTTSGSDVVRGLGLALLSVAVSSIGVLVVSAVGAVVVREGILGRHVRSSAAWEEVRPRLGTVVGAALLGTLAWGSLAITLIGIPFAVFLYVAWRFATVVAVVEGGTVRGVLRRSRRVTANRWWRACGVLLLIALVVAVVSEIVTIPFVIVAGGTGFLTGGTSLSTQTLAIVAVGQLVATTLVTPFTACATAILYVDLRMRGEGLDVALRQAASGPS
jgi:hypothetical protein